MVKVKHQGCLLFNQFIIFTSTDPLLAQNQVSGNICTKHCWFILGHFAFITPLQVLQQIKRVQEFCPKLHICTNRFSLTKRRRTLQTLIFMGMAQKSCDQVCAS